MDSEELNETAEQETPREAQTTRTRFLKQLGIAVAAGLGIAAVTPSVAYAQNNCCPSSTHPCVSCPPCDPPVTDYFCNCSQYGLEDYCTGCRQDIGCYTGPC
jgi:hypothetical protein